MAFAPCYWLVTYSINLGENVKRPMTPSPEWSAHLTPGIGNDSFATSPPASCNGKSRNPIWVPVPGYFTTPKPWSLTWRCTPDRGVPAEMSERSTPWASQLSAIHTALHPRPAAEREKSPFFFSFLFLRAVGESWLSDPLIYIGWLVFITIAANPITTTTITHIIFQP